MDNAAREGLTVYYSLKVSSFFAGMWLCAIRLSRPQLTFDLRSNFPLLSRPCAGHGQAAADKKDLTGDETRSLIHKKGDAVGNISRRTQTTNWNAVDEVLGPGIISGIDGRP